MRAGIFVAALIPRLLVAYVTLGSVDAIHCLRNFVRILDGVPIDTPYLPGIELLLWVAGLVAYASPLPVLFAWKVVPAVCDALIALLLVDAARDRATGYRAGLIYAFNPIPILIACVHPQWESMWIYALLLTILLCERKSALAGVALVLSVIVKPVALPVAIFLIPRDRKRAFAFIGGAAVAGAVYALILAATGLFPDFTRAQGVVQYASGGVQVFGLAFRPHNRLLPVLGALAVAGFIYFRGKCTRGEAVLIFFAITLGLSGLSVQYLAWIIPFAVLCGRWRFVALYTIAAGVFTFFYYLVPEINLLHIEDLGALAVLKPLAAFGPVSPPMWMQLVLQLAGNVVIPLLLLGLAAFDITRLLSRTKPVDTEPAAALKPLLMPAAITLLLFALAVAWAAAQKKPDPYAWIARIEQRIDEYDVTRYRGAGIREGTKVWLATSLIDPFAMPGGVNRILNVTNLGVAWIAVAALIAALSSRANDRREVA